MSRINFGLVRKSLEKNVQALKDPVQKEIALAEIARRFPTDEERVLLRALEFASFLEDQPFFSKLKENITEACKGWDGSPGPEALVVWEVARMASSLPSSVVQEIAYRYARS